MFNLFSGVKTTDVLPFVDFIFGIIRALFGIKKETPIDE